MGWDWETMETSTHDGNAEHMKIKIESIRDRMMELGSVRGFHDPEVLNTSRELDLLIVNYLKQRSKN